uniref:Uncharacterized protein n=1 Tax=viral metagenome TaxID=1070528 RepID=A0A6C0IL37_9ZZZZ
MKNIISTYVDILCNINRILHKNNKILPENKIYYSHDKEMCTCSQHHFYGRCSHLLSV